MRRKNNISFGLVLILILISCNRDKPKFVEMYCYPNFCEQDPGFLLFKELDDERKYKIYLHLLENCDSNDIALDFNNAGFVNPCKPVKVVAYVGKDSSIVEVYQRHCDTCRMYSVSHGYTYRKFLHKEKPKNIDCNKEW